MMLPVLNGMRLLSVAGFNIDPCSRIAGNPIHVEELEFSGLKDKGWGKKPYCLAIFIALF